MKKNNALLKKRMISTALCASMVLPGMMTSIPVWAGTVVPNGEDAKDVTMVWSSSFEEGEENLAKFKGSTLDEAKGMQNIVAGIKQGLTGDVSYLVDLDSITGSTDFNQNETKKKLFDGTSSTKFLTSENKPSEETPVTVAWKLKEGEKKAVNTYSIFAANDASGRDPKSWRLEARNADTEEWIVLDTQTEQEFKERFEQKTFQFENSTPYNAYRLVITENNGEGMTQFSEIIIATGNEADDKPIVKTMYSEISTGPVDVWNQKANAGWTGKKALEVAGAIPKEGEAYAYNTIYDDINIPVDASTYLSYVVFPAMASTYDYDYSQMHFSMDLKFTDGTYLSDLAAKDQNGNELNPVAQGQSRTLTTNQWNQLYSKIGEVAAGRTIEDVVVAYKMPEHKGDPVAFKSYFDDIKIYKKGETDYVHLSDYTNILRGTNDSPGFSRGLTAPAVTRPHGFNFWAPATNYDDNKIYDYQDTSLKYMTISHEPSYWVGDRGTWQFMVNTSLDASAESFSLRNMNANFSHDNETAKAHYYSVEFDKDKGDAKGAKMELTPTDHGATVRISFDEGVSNKNMLFDCIRANGGMTFAEDGKSFTAYSDHTGNGSKRMYVYGEFSEAPVQVKASGGQGIARFADNTKTVEIKMASSYISAEQAKHNMELEIGGNDFDTVFAESQSVWDEQLSTIDDVEGATEEQLITLYSNLYRLNAYPNNMSENTGTNEAPVWKYKSPYRDSDAEPADGKIYINNGFWDTYRTAWSAYALFTPEKDTELLDGLVQHYKDQSWVPRWIAPGGTNSMVGTSSDVIFADAAVKGIDFDMANAYQSTLRNAASVSKNLTNGGRKNLNASIFLGYTPGAGESFSWSMEGYINDFGIAQMAKTMSEQVGISNEKAAQLKAEAQYYMNRAQNYTLLFDNGDGTDINTKWFKGKEADGSYTTGNFIDGEFSPLFWGSDYTETNAYNMAVSVPQDGQGLANLYGGKEELAKKLDTIFTTNAPYWGYNAVNSIGGIHEQKEAREIKLGQYGHSNQPAHHIIYMYNFAGQPWMAQKYVRDVLDRCYTGASFGQGYIGDEDNGEMSAWYLFSALGFYPVTVGSDEYAIGSPLFTKATVNMDNGKKITISAPDNSRENVYVQGVKLNGQAYDKSYFKHSDLAEGATIEFAMGSEPNTNWGSSDDAAPSSITKDDKVPEVKKDIINKNAKVQTDITDGTKAVTEPVIASDIAEVAAVYDNTSDTTARLNAEGKSTFIYSNRVEQKVDMVTLTSSEEENAPAGQSAPTGFSIYGANDGEEWTPLAAYENITFDWDKYTRPFATNADKAYKHYKLELTGSAVAEIELLGNRDDTIYKEDLQIILDRAKEVDKNEIRDTMVVPLDAAVSQAEGVIGNQEATKEDIAAAYKALQDIMNKINGIRNAYDKIEAEQFNDRHDVIVDDGANIGGVKKNTWVKYEDIKFSGNTNSFEIFYSAQSIDAGGYVEVYLDSMGEGSKPIFKVEVPKTGAWSDYKLASTKELLTEEAITGFHDVYLVFKNDTKDPYVSNVDWFKFAGNYSVKAEVAGGKGKVAVEKEVIEKDENAVINITPDAGQMIQEVKVNNKAIDLSTLVKKENSYQLTVEKANKNVNVAVTFTKEVKLANYKAVDDAIAKVPKDLTIYTKESLDRLTKSLNAVDRTKTEEQQAEVDKMAKDILDAIKGLEEKGEDPKPDKADYGAVDAAIKKVPSDLTIYTKESLDRLTKALDAVDRNKTKEQQAEVDKMAKDILDAIDALVEKTPDTKPDPEPTPDPEPIPDPEPDVQQPSTPAGSWVANGTGWWYSYENGGFPAAQWQYIGGQWYHFDTNGYMETGWINDGNIWYYANGSGQMETGWVNDNGTWYYTNGSGAMQFGWIHDNGTWYYTNGSGAMQTDWLNDNGTWYYLLENGAMFSGWINDGGTWYYTNEGGAMQFGWVSISGVWYYMNGSGAMQTGWVNDNGTWYYTNGSGAMQTGWVNDNGTWYYTNESGGMLTGWLQLADAWYYLKDNGAMVETNFNIGGKLFQFSSDGKWKN